MSTFGVCYNMKTLKKLFKPVTSKEMNLRISLIKKMLRLSLVG